MGRLILGLGMALLIGCGAVAPRPIPASAREAFEAGQAAAGNGDPDAARDAYRRAVDEAPHFAEAQLALVRLLAPDAARAHADQLAASPSQAPVGWLLQAELAHASDPEAARALYEAAADERPTMTPAVLGLARLDRAARRWPDALAGYRRVLLLDGEHREALVGAAHCHVRQFEWGEALAAARAVLELDPRAREGHVLLAVDRLVQRDYPGAIDHYRAIRRHHPEHVFDNQTLSVFALAYRGQLQRQRIAGEIGEGLTLAREACREFGRSGLMFDYLGWFVEQQDGPAAAEPLYRRALALDPYRLETVRDLRRVLFARGLYAEAVAIWRRLVPIDLLLRPDNALAPAFATLMSHAAAGIPVRDPAAFARAAQAVGWLDEAAALFELAGVSAEAERARLAGVRRFLRDWRHWTLAHYKRLEKGDGATLEALAEWVGAHWPGPEPVDLMRDLDRHYMVVRESDPFRIRSGSLAAALAPYNLVFDIGDNSGYLDVRVMKLLYRARRVQRVGALTYSYTPLITDETLIDNFLGYLSGQPRVSGRAFVSRLGFYVALDTFRPHRGAMRRFLRPPRRQRVAGDAYDPQLDAALRARFLGRHGLPYPIAEPTAAQLDRAFAAYLRAMMSNVWLHELGHLVDFEQFVPFSENLLSNVGVALRSGFRPSAVEQRFERVAETFSLALSRYPYLALQDNLDRLNLDPDTLYYVVMIAWQKTDPRRSPYYIGARRILESLAGAVPAPRVPQAPDPHWLAHLAALSPEQIRQCAAQLCRDEGMPFD